MAMAPLRSGTAAETPFTTSTGARDRITMFLDRPRNVRVTFLVLLAGPQAGSADLISASNRSAATSIQPSAERITTDASVAISLNGRLRADVTAAGLIPDRRRV
ncbi:hypothetical protein F5X96DRAFT_670000 [Biscogniauxia mediterranea]|nr:hypothetical protein F5X96DRAFT_670000 [Biscogniauxia mediterranea]